MKTITWFHALVVGLCLAISMAGAGAADTAPVTLSGTMVCGKCKLHITEKCENVLQVDQDGKTVNYFLTQNKVSKDFHSKVCKGDGMKVTVTGTVQDENGKEVLTASKIEPAQ